jgi:hypothetical protein
MDPFTDRSSNLRGEIRGARRIIFSCPDRTLLDNPEDLNHRRYHKRQVTFFLEQPEELPVKSAGKQLTSPGRVGRRLKPVA